MANYPLENIKIGANTYNLPVSKSYNISFGTNTAISSWSSSGENLNITNFKDQNGNTVSDASILIPSNGAVSLKADLYIGSSGKQYDIQLNSVVPDGSGYKIMFFTKEFYIECSTDGHSLISAKGYQYNGGGSMDYDIIADEFGINVPSHPQIYSQYDIVDDPTEPNNHYFSLINNNTDYPFGSSNWRITTINSGGPGSTVYDGNTVIYNGEYYINLSGGTQMFDLSHWSDMGFVKGNYKGTWSSGTSGYSVGDYCIYNNDLYRCKTANAGTTWNSAQWTKTQIMDEIPSSIVSSVTVNPIYTSGTPIAQITVTDSNGTTGTTLVAPSGSSALLLQIHCSGSDTLASVLSAASSSGSPQTKSLATIIDYSDYLSAINSGKVIRVIDDVNSNSSFDIIYNNSFVNPIEAYGIFPVSNMPRSIGVEFTINSSNKITALTFRII